MLIYTFIHVNTIEKRDYEHSQQHFDTVLHVLLDRYTNLALYPVAHKNNTYCLSMSLVWKPQSNKKQ